MVKKTLMKRAIAWLPFGENDRKRLTKGFGRFTHEIKQERERLERAENDDSPTK